MRLWRQRVRSRKERIFTSFLLSFGYVGMGVGIGSIVRHLIADAWRPDGKPFAVWLFQTLASPVAPFSEKLLIVAMLYGCALLSGVAAATIALLLDRPGLRVAVAPVAGLAAAGQCGIIFPIYLVTGVGVTLGTAVCTILAAIAIARILLNRARKATTDGTHYWRTFH